MNPYDFTGIDDRMLRAAGRPSIGGQMLQPGSAMPGYENTPFAQTLRGPDGQTILQQIPGELDRRAQAQRLQAAQAAAPSRPSGMEQFGDGTDAFAQNVGLPFQTPPVGPMPAAPEPPAPMSPPEAVQVPAGDPGVASTIEGLRAAQAAPQAPTAGVLATAPPAAPPTGALSQGPAAPSPRAAPGGSFEDRMIAMESNGDPNARNPRSTATGAGQFIDPTWLSMVRSARPDLANGRSDGEILALRNDPALSREMISAYAARNAPVLTAAGLPATGVELGLAHRFGPQGAVAVLRADPNAPIAGVVGDAVMRANPDLAGRSVGAVVATYQQRFGGTDRTMLAGQAAAPPAPPDAGPPAAPPQPAMGEPEPAAPAPTNLLDPQMLALAGGFFSGRNPMESFANAANGLNATQTTQRREAVQNATNVEDRAFRRQQASLASRRADQTDARLAAADRRDIARDTRTDQGRWTTVGTFQAPDGRQMVTQTHSVTGEVRQQGVEGVRATDANQVTPERRARAATNEAFSTEVFQAAEAGRVTRDTVASVRAVVNQDPNLVGPSWRSQGARVLATGLGINVDGKSPADIEALVRGLTNLEQSELIRMAPVLRPLSNTDVPTILRAVPGLLADPRNLQAWLDRLDRGADRSIQRAGAFSEMRRDPAQAARYGEEGFRAWDSDWNTRFNSRREAGENVSTPGPRSDIQPAPGGGWTSTNTPNGPARGRLLP